MKPVSLSEHTRDRQTHALVSLNAKFSHANHLIDLKKNLSLGA